MKHSGAVLAWLAFVWVFLWENPSPGNVTAGLLAGGLVLVLFPPRHRPRHGRLRPVPVLRFLCYFLWKLLEASVIVAWEIITPGNRTNKAIVAIPIHGASDALTTVVANAISLTPGTLTLEVHRDPTVLYVHVLHLRGVEDVHREVQYLELLAVRAFGSDELVRSSATWSTAGNGEET